MTTELRLTDITEEQTNAISFTLQMVHALECDSDFSILYGAAWKIIGISAKTDAAREALEAIIRANDLDAVVANCPADYLD